MNDPEITWTEGVNEIVRIELCPLMLELLTQEHEFKDEAV